MELFVDNMMAAITENLSCRSLHMQARAVNNSYGAAKVSQHGLPPHLCESQGLNVHAPNQSWHSSSGHLDFQLAVASADAHRGLGESSSSETDVLGITKCFIVMALDFYWKVSAVFMTLFSRVDILAPFKASPVDTGNAVAEVGGKLIAQSICRAQLGCSTLQKHKINLVIVRPPSSIMRGQNLMNSQLCSSFK